MKNLILDVCYANFNLDKNIYGELADLMLNTNLPFLILLFDLDENRLHYFLAEYSTFYKLGLVKEDNQTEIQKYMKYFKLIDSNGITKDNNLFTFIHTEGRKYSEAKLIFSNIINEAIDKNITIYYQGEKEKEVLFKTLLDTNKNLIFESIEQKTKEIEKYLPEIQVKFDYTNNNKIQAIYNFLSDLEQKQKLQYSYLETKAVNEGYEYVAYKRCDKKDKNRYLPLVPLDNRILQVDSNEKGGITLYQLFDVLKKEITKINTTNPCADFTFAVRQLNDSLDTFKRSVK